MGAFDNRHDLVYSFSDGRTENSADLLDHEIDRLIRHLESGQPGAAALAHQARGDRMRKRILSICYNIGWTVYSERKRRTVVDMQRLDAWMKKYSYKHKELSRYTYRELPQLVTQFEKMEATIYD
jgi:hypothetical protein